MNCANHAGASAVAYCRTCGKPLCANCTRPVRGVIYCEDCLGARMETGGTAPGAAVPGAASGFVPGTIPAPVPGYIPPPPPTGSGSGPNPTVAGILAGFFPFGVGAVYTGQYAKGLAHLVIFGLLIAGVSGADSSHTEALGVICGLGIAFFIVYQIIDAVRSAKAIQMAQPVPDPFGLAATFGGGSRAEASKIPMGAVVLIGIGILFLLHTMGLTEFGLDRFWPLILIGLGAWLFARNWGVGGFCCSGCPCARCRSRRLMGPAMLVTIGGLFLLESLHVANFGRTWPVILLVIGAVKLLQGSASTAGHVPPPGLGSGPMGGPIPPVPPAPPVPPPPAPPVVPTSEVNRG
jgi:Domain of unknown function (DUF5668)/B-box zinc finger